MTKYRELFRSYTSDQVDAYIRKHTTVVEKNIVFVQIVSRVRKHIRKPTKWLDAPIGAALLMDEIPFGQKFGLDYSPAMVGYSETRGIQVTVADILNEGSIKGDRIYDVVTCTNFLFGFCKDDQILALGNLARLLKTNGVLIFNIDKRGHMENYDCSEKESAVLLDDRGWDREEI